MDAHLLLSVETFCQNTGNVFSVKEILFLTLPFDNPFFVFCPSLQEDGFLFRTW